MMPTRSAISSAACSVCVDIKMHIPAADLVPQQVLDQAHAVRIEPDHRLVHHQHPRRMEQRRGEHRSLLHAVRISFGQFVDEFGQFKPARFRDQWRCATCSLSIPYMRPTKLQNLAARKFVVQIRLVGHVAHERRRPREFGSRGRSRRRERCPLPGRIRPTSILMAVVLPAPLWPSRA